MTILIFTACLLADPDRCTYHRNRYVDVTPMQCLMAGQAILAKWQTDNPAWRVTEWRCEGGKMEVEA